MSLPDIKDAGTLADVRLFGWPYHGLHANGKISLHGGGEREMAAPSHGSAWLYDLGIPLTERTEGEAAVDASRGHQWLNYAFISGGVVYGVKLGDNQFVHVDGDNKRWLITITASAPQISEQKVRLEFGIKLFGVLRENPQEKSSTRTIDVQCTKINQSSLGSTFYDRTQGALEDVWTNGSKALYGIYRANGEPANPSATRDMYSLLEIVITGAGGENGVGLSISATEIRKNTELSYASSASGVLFDPVVAGTHPMSPESIPWEACDGTEVTFGPYTGVVWSNYAMPGNPGYLDLQPTSRGSYVSFARIAYYDNDGLPHIYRLAGGYRQDWKYNGASAQTNGGSQSISKSGVAPNITGVNETTAVGFGETAFSFSVEYGLTLFRDDIEIDAVKVSQDMHGALLWAARLSAGDACWADDRLSEVPIPGYAVGKAFSSLETDDFIPPVPAGCVSSGPPAHYFGVGVQQKQACWSAPVMKGSLAEIFTTGMPDFSGTQSFTDDGSPMPLSEASIVAIYNSWRLGSIHESGGSAYDIGDGNVVGLQRIDAKSVAFYKVVSGKRVYGAIHTPKGKMSYAGTPEGNLYFSWNRKTGETAFSTTRVCYV